MRRFLVFLAALPLFGADFTVAVIPDPQNIFSGTLYQAMCQWIVDQKQQGKLNVVAVLGVGDWRNTPTADYETAHATNCFATIDAAGIPWLAVPGNHDYTNYGSIRRTEISNWDAAFGPSATFNGAPISAKSWYGGNYTTEATSHANWWIKWNVGTQKFLALGLEVCPRPAVLAWASGVLAANSDRQAILVTHSYQDSDGTLTAHGDNYGCGTGAGGMDAWYDNHNDFGGYDGPQLWSNFITNEPAIKTVLSGHILYSPYVAYMTSINTAGKPVLQIKTDFQIADQNSETDRRVVTLLTYRDAGANCGTAPNDHPAPCIEASHYSTAANEPVVAYPPRGYAYEFQPDLPSPPINLTVASVTETSATLAWHDQADNEIGFIIERQDVPLDITQALPDYVEVGRMATGTPGPMGFGYNAWTNTNLLPGRTYNYQVRAYNVSGASEPSPAVAATTLGPPPAPTYLAASVVSAYQVDLTWTDTSGIETGFRVERATDAGFSNVMTFTAAANVTSFTDNTTGGGMTYHYRVMAFNAAGNSASSNAVTVTTPPEIPPPAPTGLTGTPTPAPNPPQVDLVWNQDFTKAKVTAFALERASGSGKKLTFAEIAGVAGNVLAYVDPTAAPKSTYTYRVRACNIAGCSAYSNQVTVTTSGQIPQAPLDIRVTNVTKNSITIMWADKSSNENGFYIERSLNGTNWVRVGTTGMNITSFTDRKLNSGAVYWYRVQAYNADGVSAYADPPVTATTQ